MEELDEYEDEKEEKVKEDDEIPADDIAEDAAEEDNGEPKPETVNMDEMKPSIMEEEKLIKPDILTYHQRVSKSLI